jgi:ABC-type Co2+ transport system permease subunit
MIAIQDIVKYLLEGVAVAVVAFYVTGKQTNLQDVALIGLSAAVSFLVLDMFAPAVGAGSRQGAGFGIGYNLAGGAADDEENM